MFGLKEISVLLILVVLLLAASVVLFIYGITTAVMPVVVRKPLNLPLLRHPFLWSIMAFFSAFVLAVLRMVF